MLSEFLSRAKQIVLENLSDEQFGVSELADALNTSRSNLLRKVKSETSLSASRFIRQARLEEAMKLIQAGQLNVSEVTREVGFSSMSYFIKCFREHYGYSPGSVGKQAIDPPKERGGVTAWWNQLLMGVGVVLLLLLVWFIFRERKADEPALEKSIAVLPFKNMSSDSSNIYLINGLMETTLNNLQKIRELRVVSRTSVERFRNTTLTVPEIAAMLPVGYLIEGSGQKINNEIHLNIQLIETATDRQVWSQQYHKEVGDIFKLQQEIANSIVSEIQVAITPEERKRIQTSPTDNLEAYDAYLKGREAISRTTREGLIEGIPYFQQAIERDAEFGSAYAYMAISYYYLDLYKVEKKHLEALNKAADKALLYAPKAPESLVAKALYYQQIGELEEAETFLLEAHEHAPGSSDIVNLLSDFYTRYSPDSRKYLEFALKGVRLLAESKDSVTTSYLYLHLSNALIQNGFVDEALSYINQCIAYDPENPFRYLKSFILYVKDRDWEQTQQMLIKEYQLDTTRLDILQEIGKLYYNASDYEKAYEVYSRFLAIREQLGLDIYQFAYLKIGDTYIRQGHVEQGRQFVQSFKEFAESDKSRYVDFHFATYYAHTGKLDSAAYHMNRFSTVEDIQYWFLLFLEDDPAMESVKNEPWFQESMAKLKFNFWKNHDQLKAKLLKEKLL